jgi:hypothetical protein
MQATTARTALPLTPKQVKPELCAEAALHVSTLHSTSQLHMQRILHMLTNSIHGNDEDLVQQQKKE